MRSKEVVTDISLERGKDREEIHFTEAEDGEGKKAAQRDKRAQNLAAMGLVTREGSRYTVKTATFRGRQASYEVWRDDKGRVRCSCDEYKEISAERPTFRCEHILAVKYSLTATAPEAEAVKKETNGAPGDQKPTARSSAARANPEKGENKASVQGRPEQLLRNPEPETISDMTIEMTRPSESHPSEIDMPESYPPEIYTPEFNNPEIYTEDYDMNGREKEAAESAQTGASSHPAPPPTPIPFANLIRALRQPVDNRLVKTREGWTDRQGNTHWVEYIEWHTVADILDRVAPDWSHAVRNIGQLGDFVAVTASITINGVTREGVGTGSIETETGIKKAEHDALKRAAVKFGIARDLYHRESDEATGATEEDGIAPNIARDPRPKTLGDLVTPKQLWMIRNLGREAGCDVEQECQALMQCKLEEISKRAASSFIDYLKRRQQESMPEEFQRAS
jgi:hypothetical protein